MRPPVLLVVAVLVSTALSLALGQLLSPPRTTAARESPDAGTPLEAAAELARIDTRLANLERVLASFEEGRVSQPERSNAEPDKAQVRAILRELLAESDAEGAAAGMRPGEAKAAFHMDTFLMKLAEPGLSDRARSKLWQEASEAGKLDEAIGVFRSRAVGNPNDAGAQVALGHALLEALQFIPNDQQKGVLAGEADQAYDKALELQPRNWEARFTKAVALSFWPAFTGKRGESIAQFEKLIEIQEAGPKEDRHAQTYLFLGNMYQDAGDTKKAFDVWQRGLRLFPESKELRGVTGRGR